MVTDLHATNQVNICKRLEKSLENRLIAKISCPKPVISPKIDRA